MFMLNKIPQSESESDSIISNFYKGHTIVILYVG